MDRGVMVQMVVFLGERVGCLDGFVYKLWFVFW